MKSRADLHVHSKHSNRPSEWILRQFGAPESYTEPQEIYRRCRERNMDFVTVSDHDSIDGALEIAHLPGTFLSCEVTAEFPEDGCQIHCLAIGISEEQHREIQQLRRNVYELRDYFAAGGILHSVAHPLFRVNDRLTLDHVEKLVVLFNRFEGLNGIHERRANDLVRAVFGALTPGVVESLAERHRLEPLGATPWVKTFTGGSDDHGGFYIGTTFTRTPPAATVEEFLGHLREGRHEPGGDTGSSLRLVQSLYSIAWEYYHRLFPALLGNRRDPFAELLRGLARGPAERESESAERPAGLRGRLARVVPFPGPRRPASPAAGEPADRATFTAAGRAHRESLASLVGDFVRQLRRGRVAESLSAVSHLAPLALSVAPYLVSLHAQHKDADLLEMAALRFLGRSLEGDRPARTAWFADLGADLGEGPGAVHVLSRLARTGGSDLVVLTCGNGAEPLALPVRTFEPLLEIPISGWALRTLSVPPLLEMLDHCERERYSEILVGTPSAVGLAGLAAGKLLGIRLSGLCFTGFPHHVGRLAGSPALEDLAWIYMRWFFGQMDRVYVGGEHDRELLAGRGFDPARVQLLPSTREIASLYEVDSDAPVLQSAL